MKEVVLTSIADVKIDTLSFSQLRWKPRTDNTFRWNFDNGVNQPLSWYNTNFRYSYWDTFNSFDVYWNGYNCGTIGLLIIPLVMVGVGIDGDIGIIGTDLSIIGIVGITFSRTAHHIM